MLHSLVRGYPLCKCCCIYIEVHFHGVLWADLTWHSYSTLAYNMGLWIVMVCHWLSSSPVFWWFVPTSCSWPSNLLGLLDCSPRDTVSHPRKTRIFYLSSWYSFLNHAPIIILLLTFPPPIILSPLSSSKMLYNSFLFTNTDGFSKSYSLPQSQSQYLYFHCP
jgi:hypothetical protein